MAVNKKQCETMVSDSGGWHHYQCRNNALKDKATCRIHDPEYIEAKQKKSRAKYEADNCKDCSYHFYHSCYKYCPICGTKRNK